MKKALFALLLIALASTVLAEKTRQVYFSSTSHRLPHTAYGFHCNNDRELHRDDGGFTARSYCGYRFPYKYSHSNWYYPSPPRIEKRCPSTLVLPVPMRYYQKDYDYITVYTPRVKSHPTRIEGELFSYNRGYIFYTYYPREREMTVWDTGRNDYFTIFLDYQDR